MPNKLINEIIYPFEKILGKEYQPYKNHVHRIALLTKELKGNIERDDEHKIAIAAVFHDIGIWTENTFDYLEPSIQAANKYLAENNLMNWSEEINLMIDMHHKRSVYKGKFQDNVESFRRADLVDLSKGMISFSLSKKLIRKNLIDFPMLGFRGIIVRNFFKNLLKHPFNPLPMFKK